MRTETLSADVLVVGSGPGATRMTALADLGVTDLAGFVPAQLVSLDWTLFLDGTQVTDAGIAELKKALPKCKISH